MRVCVREESERSREIESELEGLLRFFLTSKMVKRDPKMMSIAHILDLMYSYRELQAWGQISRLYNTVL